MVRRREDLLRLLAQLDTWIKDLDQRLKQEAEGREAARLLMPHPGVGPLTALGIRQLTDWCSVWSSASRTAVTSPVTWG